MVYWVEYSLGILTHDFQCIPKKKATMSLISNIGALKHHGVSRRLKWTHTTLGYAAYHISGLLVSNPSDTSL